MTIPPDAAARFAYSDGLLVRAIADKHEQAARAIVVGLAGPQGSGKSTSAARLATALRAMDLAVTVCSIDDFYLGRTAREALGVAVHPLFATRGAPGTHDVALAHRTLDALIAGSATALPRFDKTTDDVMPDARWPIHTGRTDVVLLEGWCIGAAPQAEPDLREPVNELELREDRDGIWRRAVNDYLARSYAELWHRLDWRIMLRAPSFEQVFGWRAEQEAKLDRSAPGARPPMDEAGLRRFIATYERLTRWMMTDEPADLIVDLDATRMPIAWRSHHLAG